MATATNELARSVFDQYASRYNQSRRILIPCFDDFYRTAIDVLPFDHEEKIAVLDLGAGTGLLSSLLASAYRHSDITLIDISRNMLEQAKKDLAEFNNNFAYVVDDYASLSLGRKFDAVISALSIHHLTDGQKKALFSTLLDHLNPGGIFVNADQVRGATDSIERTYRTNWLQQVRDRGISDIDLRAALERMKADRMSTLAEQLQWLAEAGFGEVTCWYQNYSFAVFSGRKLCSQ